MADQPKSSPVSRPMMRCLVCERWWSKDLPPRVEREGPEAPQLCGCGGRLAVVDMERHLATVPYVPFDSTKK